MMVACSAPRRIPRRRGAWAAILLILTTLILCLWGQAEKYPQPGEEIYQKDGAFIDATNISAGYIRVKQEKTDKRVKVRVSKDGTQLDYDLNNRGEYEVLPLQLGDGEYKVTIYVQLSGDRYLANLTKRLRVTLDDALSPYLYPNQYVWFTPESQVVAQAAEICQGLDSDREKFAACAEYIRRHVTYDFFLAMNVKSGYLPDVDETLQSRQGICFDYAALLAAMLRSQEIPCRLSIGYADTKYHAWTDVYLDGAWERYDPTYAATGGKAEQYTAQRFY